MESVNNLENIFGHVDNAVNTLKRIQLIIDAGSHLTAAEIEFISSLYLDSIDAKLIMLSNKAASQTEISKVRLTEKEEAMLHEFLLMNIPHELPQDDIRVHITHILLNVFQQMLLSINALLKDKILLINLIKQCSRNAEGG